MAAGSLDCHCFSLFKTLADSLLSPAHFPFSFFPVPRTNFPFIHGKVSYAAAFYYQAPPFEA